MLKRLFGKFTGAAPAADAQVAARVDALYADASAVWQGNRHATAAARAADAIALDATLPALHYLQGCALFALERNDAAAAAMQRCLALRPAYPRWS